MTIGVCRGCKAVVLPGPYFRRRCRRHLALPYHNHDALRLLQVPDKLELLMDGVLYCKRSAVRPGAGVIRRKKEGS